MACFAGNQAVAQNDHFGARSAGMANNAVALTDLWAVHHNQGGLAFLEKPAAGAFYENRFLISALGYRGGIAALPTKSGTFGLQFSSFGYNLYRENEVGIAYGRKLSSKLGLGIKLNYHRTVIPEPYGATGVLTGEVGLLMKVSEKVNAGVHLFNPTRTSRSTADDDILPTVIRLGGTYSFSEQLLLSAETEKDIDRAPVFRGGIEYRVAKPVYLRVGAGSQPYSWAFGFGFAWKKLKFDLAASNHPVLGTSPQISFQYQLK